MLDATHGLQADETETTYPEAAHLTMALRGANLSLSLVPGNPDMALRLDWQWPAGAPAHRFVTLEPEDRQELLEFLQAAPGPDNCRFCAAPLAEVAWFGQSRISTAIICDGCVAELAEHLPHG